MIDIDDPFKLCIRTLLADVLKEGRHDKYFRAIIFTRGQVSIFDPSPRPVARIRVWVTLRWPASPEAPVVGDIQITYPRSDGSAAEQSLPLQGIPAKTGGRRWRVTCPVTNLPVQAIYLDPNEERFVSRQAAGLKYPRTKAERALRRGERLMHQLKTDRWGPGIARPEGMSEKQFLELENKLAKEHTRYLCALLGKPDPEFWDDKESRPRQKRAPRFPDEVRNSAMFTRHKSGKLKMKTSWRKGLGLPQR
jgi:hypothetical protein